VAVIKKDNFSAFGGNFQTKVLQALMLDQSFYEKIFEILYSEYFEMRSHQEIHKLITSYYEKYKTVPTIDTLEVEIRVIDDVILKEESYIILNEIKKSSVADLKYIKDEALSFCKNQKMKKALLQSVDYLQQGNFDEIFKTIKEALNAGENTEVGHNYFDHFDARVLMMNRSAISTGWKVVDDVLNGGYGRGELSVYIAGTGIGKSWALAYAGYGALKQSKTVLHYTFELYEHAVGSRYDALISGTPIDQIQPNKDFVKGKIEEFNTQYNGKLIIKSYPTKTATVNAIRNHINKLAHFNIVPDILIVDYADLMSTRKSYEQKRYELESIYEELRALAGELQIPVVTASQTNRSSLDDEVVTLAAISESYAKAQVADVIISISRRLDDKRLNKAKMYIAKNRAGKDGIVFPMIMNTTAAKLDVLEETGIDPELEFGNDRAIKESIQKHFIKKNGEKSNG
jgi:replicative DNA helicase